eukprot:GABW01002963.1.p1 GENE.GABW01002963.1~~GABW01002963.1.p1  ORF type:complete len:89 (-),score=3.91 GABW01002963.1:17-283(-)
MVCVCTIGQTRPATETIISDCHDPITVPIYVTNATCVCEMYVSLFDKLIENSYLNSIGDHYEDMSDISSLTNYSEPYDCQFVGDDVKV